MMYENAFNKRNSFGISFRKIEGKDAVKIFPKVGKGSFTIPLSVYYDVYKRDEFDE